MRSITLGPKHLLAAGVDSNGLPLMADVTGGDFAILDGDYPDRFGSGLDTVASDLANIAVTENDQTGKGAATFWLGDELMTYWRQAPRDEQGRRPMWLQPLMDGEEDLRAVGVVRDADGWRLRAWQAYRRWTLLDGNRRLYLQTKPSSRTVVSGSTETTVIVAGPISEQPHDAAGPPKVWTIFDDPSYSHRRWREHRMGSTPDGVTDVAYWDLGWWVAGHRNLRPVVYDFDRGNGASMAVPDTRLDPDHPVVYVAGIPISQPMVLTTQSLDGPTLWVRRRTGWVRVPAPAGMLSAAEAVEDGVYLLIDGTLWFRRLPGLRG